MIKNILPTTRAGKLSIFSFVIYQIATTLSSYIEDTALGDLGFLFLLMGLIAGFRAIYTYKERSILVIIFVILSVILFAVYAVLFILVVIGKSYGGTALIAAFGVVAALIIIGFALFVAKLIKGRK